MNEWMNETLAPYLALSFEMLVNNNNKNNNTNLDGRAMQMNDN